MKFKVEIDLDNDAFFDGDATPPFYNYSSVLNSLFDCFVPDKFETLSDGCTIPLRDYNGNAVGRAWISK